MEVLIVIGMIGLLVGMTIPAILHSRESSRLVDCQNRLRQIGLAALSYESQRGYLPPGVLGAAEAFPFDDNYLVPTSKFYWRRFQYTSSLALILPFLDEGARLANLPPVLFDVDHPLDYHVNSQNQPRYRWFGEIPGVIAAAKQNINAYRCPTDSFDESEVWEYRGAIQPVYSSEILDEAIAYRDLWPETGERLGMTNYAGCMGADAGGIPANPERRRFLGLMSSRQKIRLQHATDGTSKTILYGEMLGRISDVIAPGKRLVVQTWMFGGYARGRGELDWQLPPEDAKLLGDAKKAGTFGFASMHPIGVAFAAADGHVFILNREVDAETLYAWCGRADQSGN